MAVAAVAATAIFLALDSTITGPGNIWSYRRSADDREITVFAALLPIDALIGQEIREEPERVVVSFRIRRLPLISQSIALLRPVVFRLREPLRDRVVVDQDGRVVREELLR